MHWACNYSASKSLQFQEVGHFWTGLALAAGQPDLEELEFTGSRYVQVAQGSSDSPS